MLKQAADKANTAYWSAPSRETLTALRKAIEAFERATGKKYTAL